MLEISKKTNLLEQSIYKYSLQDVEEPNLYREMFNYEEVPKLAFNQRRVPMNMPEDVLELQMLPVQHRSVPMEKLLLLSIC